MKIYTKSGDSGETQVYAKQAIRLGKDDALLDTYGDLDELNANTGLLISYLAEHGNLFEESANQLEQIQQDLFKIGFAISDSSTLDANNVSVLEQNIDHMQLQLQPQTHFILPGGSKAASQAHVCRTVCRRAERRMVALSKVHDVQPAGLAYLNRLSDYLFVLARYLNSGLEVADVKV